jgi:transcriptional regulator with XRE-family HTH domain
VRVAKGIYRRELARAVGISYSTLRRLEQQELPNAPLWWYRNCAIALGVELDDVIDDRERGWRPTLKTPEPPGPEWPYRGEGQITWR